MQSTVCMHKNQSAEYAKISGDTDMRNAKINFQGGKKLAETYKMENESMEIN